MKTKVAIIGAGSFATAVAYHLAYKYRENPTFGFTIYARSKETVQEINQNNTNKKYAKDTLLPENLRATNELSSALEKANYIIMGVPAQATRAVCTQMRAYLHQNPMVINLAKGIEIGTFKRMSEVIAEELKAKKNTIASLGGPAFAKDILAFHPIGVTIGSKSYKKLYQIRELFDTPVFDVKITKDLKGVELGGALKNIFGIMAGMMQGIDMGNSINGDFLTRSIVDMKAIASYMGAKRATLDGRAGLGDLAITCTEHSRNFRFGREFTKVYQHHKKEQISLENIVEETFKSMGCTTVEGYFSLKPLYNFCAQKNIFVPIVNHLYDVLYQHTCSPTEAIHNSRIRDKIRSRENRLPLSRFLSFLLPRLWYRRERGFIASFINQKEQKLIERYCQND